MDDLTWRQAEPKGQSLKLSEISNERWSDEKNVEGNSQHSENKSLIESSRHTWWSLTSGKSEPIAAAI